MRGRGARPASAAELRGEMALLPGFAGPNVLTCTHVRTGFGAGRPLRPGRRRRKRYLPKNEKLSVESRHLGLKQAFELKGSKELEEKKQLFKEIAQNCLDLEKIYEIAEEFETKSSMDSFEPIMDLKNKYKGKRVGVAKDGAFSFYYESNLELMRFSGLEIVEFSPVKDEKIPENLDMI